MERGLRGSSAQGQRVSGDRGGPMTAPVLLLLLGSHLPSSPPTFSSLLLPQGGLSPPHPPEHPGADSGAWGARGVPAWQPGVGGGFWGTPWPGNPAAASPAQATPACGRLCPGAPRINPRERFAKISWKPEKGGQGEPRTPGHGWGARSVLPVAFTELPLCCGCCQNPWQFRGFAASLLRSELSGALQPPLVPWEEQGQGRTTWRCPWLVPLPSPRQEGHPEGPVLFSPSLHVLHPKAAAVSVWVRWLFPGCCDHSLQPGWSHRQG